MRFASLGRDAPLCSRSLERFAIALGLFEVVFIITMALESHDPAIMAKDMCAQENIFYGPVA